MNLRPITPADIVFIARWVAQTPLWQRYSMTESTLRERFTRELADGATIYVAEDAGQAVGFIWIVERGAFNRSGYVQLIGVHPDARHRGVGFALMQFAEAQLGVRAPEIFLLVSDFNADAQRFYERLGYEMIGKLEDYVVRGVSELIYWKRVTDRV